MPNWIEGTFKIRGTIEQIRNFAYNEFGTLEQEEVSSLNTIRSLVSGEELKMTEKDIEVNVDEYDIKISSKSALVFKSLRRAYSGQGTGYIWDNDDEEDESKQKHIVIFDDFKAAWGLAPSSVLDMAIKYGIDVYFHGFECGMEFEQIIEVVDGKIKQSFERKYDNYAWKCPFPGLGG